MLKRTIIGGLALAFAMGCGPSDELGPEDSATAWAATQKTLNNGTAGGPNALLTTKFSADCQDGGSAVYKYSLADNLFASADATSVGAEWSVRFKGCEVDGVKMKGNLDFSISSQTSADGAYTEWSYSGDLVYLGDLKGACMIDMVGKAGANSSGASFEYSGTICGNDASLTLNAGADGVSAGNNVSADNNTGDVNVDVTGDI